MMKVWRKSALIVLLVLAMVLCVGGAVALAEEISQTGATQPATTCSEGVVPSGTNVQTSLAEQNTAVNNESGSASVTQQEAPVVTNEGGTEATPTQNDQTQFEASASANPPQVTTDRNDYVPGEIAIISGANFGTNENVRVVITADQTTTVSDQTVATDNAGNFSATYIVDAYRNFMVVATGQTSGLAAAATFTDCHFELTKAADPSSDTVVGWGEEITYTLEYENVGTKTATDVVLTDPLPSYVQFVSATNGGYLDGNVVKWDLGTLGAGCEVTVSFTVRVLYSAPRDGAILNQAHVEGYYDNGETKTTADSNETTHTVGYVELVIVKTGPPTATPGEIYTYKLVYGNTGNTTAKDVIVRDTVPKLYVAQIVDAGGGAVTDDGTNWIITWPEEDIPANTTGLAKTVQVRLVATFPVGATTITNTVRIGVEEEGEVIALEGEDPGNNVSSVDTVVEVTEVPPEEPTPEGELPVTGDYSVLLMLIVAGLAVTGFALRRKYA